MSRLLGISIQNFGVLKNVRLGRLADDLKAEPLGTMTTFIGPNGTGKSTIVGVFEFLADCFRYGVHEACEIRNPGGFTKICSQGSDNTIRFEFFFQVSSRKPLLTYCITFKAKDPFNPYVYEEKLLSDVGENQKFLFYVREGVVIDSCIENVDSKKTPAILRTIQTNGEASSFFNQLKLCRKDFLFLPAYTVYSTHSQKFFLWLSCFYLCRFNSKSTPKWPNTRLQPRLNRTCSNLKNVAAYLYKTDVSALEKINQALRPKIPNFERIKPITLENGQFDLAIYQKGAQEPLYSSNASDGTLKLFAYYLLLNEVEGSKLRRLVCIEEPENGLYHTYLPDLAGDMAESASKGRQIFVTTHSPYFVNALFPKDVWVLSRGSDGFAQARRASDFPSVNALFEEEIPLGDLWHNEYLEGEIR